MGKSIIFDWSGTLNNNFDCFYKVYSLISQELQGPQLTKEEIKKTFTLPYMKFWNVHFPNLSKERQDKLYKKYIHQTEGAKIFSGVKETIENLHKKGCRLFILSSDPLSKLIPEVEVAEIKGFFEEIIGEIHEKDKVLKEIIEKNSLDKEKTYYVGDTSGDIEAGKIAQIKTIGISWGFQDTEKLAKSNPDYLIDNITKIEKYL